MKLWLLFLWSAAFAGQEPTQPAQPHPACGSTLAGVAFDRAPIRMTTFSAPIELGKFIATGNGGFVYEVKGKEIPAGAAIKIFETPEGVILPEMDVIMVGQAYARVHELLPDNCVRPLGLAQMDKRTGLVMDRIPEDIRVFNPRNVTARTITDLKRIQETLLANQLYVGDLNFTVAKDGRVILYDLDNLRSWNPRSPFINRASEKLARSYMKMQVQIAIERVQDALRENRDGSR